MDKIKKLEDLIAKASDAYYNKSAPIMSDARFDALIEQLEKLDPDNALLKTVGTRPDSKLKKEQHKIPMGSLFKIKTPEEFVKWTKGRIDYFLIQEKLDGLSVSLNYKTGILTSALTRGDGITGERIEHNVIHMQNVKDKLPDNFTGSLRGEIILSKTDFAQFFPEDKTARNTASGTARRKKTTNKVKYLFVLYYDCVSDDLDFDTEHDKITYIRDKLGLRTVFSVQVNEHTAIDIYFDYLNGLRKELNHEIDGMVIKINDLEEQHNLGIVDGRPKGQVAWKFPSVGTEAMVEAIEWTVGVTGRVTPVAHISPTEIDGVTIKKVTLHNPTFVEETGIGPGATILLKRANDVIPFCQSILSVGENESVPENCPVCNGQLTRKGDYLLCKNEDCPARRIGDLKKWIKGLEIDQAGPEFLNDVIEAGFVEDPADLYELTVEQLLTLPGYKKTKAKKIIDNIQATKYVDLCKFMAALNIPNIGLATFKAIEKMGNHKLDQMLAFCTNPYDMENIDGMGRKKAIMVREGINSKMDLIIKLFKVVTIKEKTMGKLSGQSFCFTGALPIKRNVAKELVEKHGGEFKTSVSKGLTYLVQADPSSKSTKAQKARKYGTEVIGPDDFLDMVGFDDEL